MSNIQEVEQVFCFGNYEYHFCYQMLLKLFLNFFHCISDVPEKLKCAKFWEILGLCPQLLQFQMPQFRNFIKTEVTIIF